MIPEKISGILAEFGHPYKAGGFYAARPGDGECYVAVLDQTSDWGDDMGRLAAVSHDISLEVYDNGGAAAEARRDRLQDLLRFAGVRHSRSASAYLQSEEKFMTVFDLETIYEKGAADGGRQAQGADRDHAGVG